MTAKAVDAGTLTFDAVTDAIGYIAENLRDADKAELTAAFGAIPDVSEFLYDVWEASAQSWIVLDRTGLPIAIFGVTGLTPEVGFAWFLGTDGVTDEWVAIARQTPKFIRRMHELFPTLYTNVDARNDITVHWLSAAGFTLSDADPAYGPEGRLFLQFVRTS